MARTAQERLDSVDAAITAIEDGGASSYSIGPRNVTKLDLKSLYEERRKLQLEVQREGGGGCRAAVIVKVRP